MLEVEGIASDVLGLVLLSIRMRVVGMLRDCNRLIEHGQDEALNAFLVGMHKRGVALFMISDVTLAMNGDVVVLPADLVELAGELLLLAVGLIIIHSKKLYRRCE